MIKTISTLRLETLFLEVGVIHDALSKQDKIVVMLSNMTDLVPKPGITTHSKLLQNVHVRLAEEVSSKKLAGPKEPESFMQRALELIQEVYVQAVLYSHLYVAPHEKITVTITVEMSSTFFLIKHLTEITDDK